MNPVYLLLGTSLFCFVGEGHYILNTIRGKTKPNRVTWLMWAIAPLIATAAALSSGVTWAVLPVFWAGLGPLLIFLASFINKEAYWKLGMFDYTCGALSVLALVFWAVTNNPVVAIALAISSDALAAIPTIIKSWKYPETETITGYAATGINSLTAFLVIKEWAFVSYAFPLYLVLINIYFVFALSRKHLKFPW